MKNFNFLLLMSLFLLIGCSQDDLIDVNVQKGKCVIRASFESKNNTRVTIGENGELLWSANDAFVLFGDENKTYTLTGEGGTTVGEFVGDEVVHVTGAAYPSSSNPTLSKGTLEMTLSTAISMDNCNLPMWASTSSNSSISFKHLVGMLKFSLNDIPTGYSTLTVTASNPLNGVFTANTSDTAPILTWKDGETVTDENKKVTATFTAVTGENENDKVFYIPLPVGNYTSIAISISNVNDEKQIIEWKNKTIERAVMYTASLTVTTDVTSPQKLSTIIAATTTASEYNIENTIDATSGDAIITIPTLDGSNGTDVTLNFNKVPNTTANAPLKIEQAESEEVGESQNKLAIHLPITSATYLEINTPLTTVELQSGYFSKITATTATNTLIIGKDVIIEELIVNGGNVKLMDNITLTNTLSIQGSGNTTFDLNEKTITISPEPSATTTVDLKYAGTGKLIITNGKIVSDNNIHSRRCIYNYGNMEIDNVEFVQTFETKGAAINNAGTMLIKDAIVDSKYWCIWNETSNGKLTIEDGIFNCNSYIEMNESENEPTYSYAVRNTSGATLNVKDGTFNCTHGFITLDGSSNATFDGGLIKHVGNIGIISSHVFWMNGAETELTVNKCTVEWDTQYTQGGNSKLIWLDEDAESTNVSFNGGSFDLIDCYGISIDFTEETDGEWTPIQPEIQGKQLKTVSITNGHDYIERYEFTYNADATVNTIKHSSIYTDADYSEENIISLTYSNNGKTIHTSTILDEENYAFEFTLNNDGYITKAIQTINGSETRLWEYVYDEGGKLVSMNRSEGSEVWTLQYNNSGDAYQTVGFGEDFDDGRVYKEIKHGDWINNSNVYFPELVYGIDIDEMEVYAIAGMLGKPSTNFPIKRTEEFDGKTYTTIFDSVVSEDGYPIKIDVEEEEEEALEITFTWENK